jgi:hypothetical protein
VKPPGVSHPLPVAHRSGHHRVFWSPPAGHRCGLVCALDLPISGKVPVRPPARAAVPAMGRPDTMLPGSASDLARDFFPENIDCVFPKYENLQNL